MTSANHDSYNRRRRGVHVKRSRGFVLLIVVVMLAICCTLLAQVAMVSMTEARSAIAVERELQQRWAVVSLRRSLLASSATLLQQTNASDPESDDLDDWEFEPLAGSIALSNRQYHFVVDDESRKLPLHALALVRPDDCAAAANVLLQRSGVTVDRRVLPSLESGQRWDTVVGRRMSPMQAIEAGRQVTLWGDGRLNLRSANTDVVRQTWRVVFGTFPPNEIVDKTLLAELPWPRVRDGLALREEQLKELDRYFSVQSSCFSLRIESHFAPGDRSWLFVADGSDQHFGYEL